MIKSNKSLSEEIDIAKTKNRKYRRAFAKLNKTDKINKKLA